MGWKRQDQGGVGKDFEEGSRGLFESIIPTLA
jgi:hypothetical protein